MCWGGGGGAAGGASWEAPDELRNGVSLLISKLKHVPHRGSVQMSDGDQKEPRHQGRGVRTRFLQHVNKLLFFPVTEFNLEENILSGPSVKLVSPAIGSFKDLGYFQQRYLTIFLFTIQPKVNSKASNIQG